MFKNSDMTIVQKFGYDRYHRLGSPDQLRTLLLCVLRRKDLDLERHTVPKLILSLLGIRPPDAMVAFQIHAEAMAAAMTDFD